MGRLWGSQPVPGCSHVLGGTLALVSTNLLPGGTKRSGRGHGGVHLNEAPLCYAKSSRCCSTRHCLAAQQPTDALVQSRFVK